MAKVLSTVEQVTPEWLTKILHRENALPQGRVVAVEKQPNSAFNSSTVYLIPTYSNAPTASTPQRLLLKCNIKQTWAIQAGAREVAFYQMVDGLKEYWWPKMHCLADAFEDWDYSNLFVYR